jgi:glycerol-3-phosphate acyltransferase PlsY
MVVQIVLGCFLAYLLGSIPFSCIIAKRVKGIDIHVKGEGNVGGRNVWHLVALLRTLGLKRIINEPYMRKIKQESGW